MSTRISQFTGPFWKAMGLMMCLYNLKIDVSSVKQEELREFAKRYSHD